MKCPKNLSKKKKQNQQGVQKRTKGIYQLFYHKLKAFTAMIELKVFRIIFGNLRSKFCMCSLDQIFVYEIWKVCIIFVYSPDISKNVSMCLGEKAWKKKFVLKSSYLENFDLFCIMGVPTLKLILVARTKVF